jgi:hypothetical protein
MGEVVFLDDYRLHEAELYRVPLTRDPGVGLMIGGLIAKAQEIQALAAKNGLCAQVVGMHTEGGRLYLEIETWRHDV